jgi:preprotein translocase subunit Sec61beta
MRDSSIKSLNSLKFGHGTYFGERGSVRIKLSDKDLVLIAGIVVAMIIALTKMLDSRLPQKENAEQAKPKVNLPSPTVLMNKISEGFTQGLAQ